MRYFALCFLLARAATAQDWEREQLPLRFAQVSAPIASQLAADWNRVARKGVEWGYCVTKYEIGATKDGDTVYVVTAIVLAKGERATRTHVDFDCTDARGRGQPTIHAHLTGDCTPSRADAYDALRGMPPFAMIVCGPGITTSYDPRLYLNAAIQAQTAAGIHQPR